MSFYGSSFSFDGHSCEEFGLMLYDFGNTSQGNSEYASGMNISEERIPGRFRSLFYGTDYKDPLEFTLIFGANEIAAHNGEEIDRQEMEVIGSWLTGHSTYKWLSIDQADLENIRYRCIITDLKMLEHAGNKWAFQCTVHCDSPYAYRKPETLSYAINGQTDIIVRSRSSINIPYYPIITFKVDGGSTLEIKSEEAEYHFTIKDFPSSVKEIYLDGEKGILRSDAGLGLYKYCNYKWPTLVRGINHLTVTGMGTLSLLCEFPVNVGG